MTPVYRTVHTLCRIAARLWFDYRVVHRERLIESGPALIVCNHVSYFDPPMVGIAYRKAIWFLARKTLLRGVGGWIYPRLQVVPVDQDNPDMTALKNIIRLLQRGERVLLFPEGARSWDGLPKPPEPGVGLVIAKAGVPVQPVRLFGTHEAMPRGASFPRPAKIRLVVGDPIAFTPEELAGKGKNHYTHLAARAMDAVTALTLPEDP